MKYQRFMMRLLICLAVDPTMTLGEASEAFSQGAIKKANITR